jgi:branched-chain amino acid transport system substrate-binding protein
VAHSRIRKYVAAVATTVLASGALAACGEKGPSSAETITIGVITPLTGASSDPGQRAKEGAEIAADIINADGGINGKNIELIFEDDKSTPEQGVLKLQELSGKGVRYITGTVNSTVAVAIGNFVRQTDTVYVITAAQTQEPLSQQVNGNIFAMSNTNALYGEVYLPWVAANLKPQTFAVLAESSDYGNNELASLQERWSGPNYPKIISERFDRSQSDFSAQLTTLIAQKPDALYAVAGGTDLPAKILKQATELGYTGIKLSGPGTISEAFITAGGAAVEGVISANVYATDIDNEVNQRFVEAFQAKYGRLPSAESALSYDSIMIMATAMKEAGGADDPAKVAQLMKAGTWSTTRGEVKFDDTGRIRAETLIVEVRNGQAVIVARP